MVRIWSLHPKYLNRRELKTCWRDGVRALRILRTPERKLRKFYPSLSVFRMQGQPDFALAYYLHVIAREARRRGIQLDESFLPKLPSDFKPKIPIGEAQLDYEWHELIRSIAWRSPQRARRLASLHERLPNPLFIIRPEGRIGAWQHLA